jgi:hypothetical protein
LSRDFTKIYWRHGRPSIPPELTMKQKYAEFDVFGADTLARFYVSDLQTLKVPGKKRVFRQSV